MMQEIVQQAQETAKFGMNVNMIDTTKKSSQQNLRTYLVELNTKTLKIISERLYSANCILKKSIENSSFAQFKPKQQRNFSILQLSEEIASFANLISTNIYTVHKNGGKSNSQIKPSLGQRQLNQDQNRATAELTQRCETLQHQLTNVNLENQRLAQIVNQKEQALTVASLNSQSEQKLKEKINFLQDQIHSLESKNKSLIQQVEENKTKSANQERSHESELQKENSQLKAKIINLQNDLSTLQEEIKSEKGNLIAAETLKLEIEKQQTAHQQQINNLKNQKTKLSEEIKKMKKEEAVFILSEQNF